MNTTIALYVSTGSTAIPPLVFKDMKIKSEWCKAGHMIHESQRGYINTELFQEYGEQFIQFLTEKKILKGDSEVLLLLNMHKSQLFNLALMEYMMNTMWKCAASLHIVHTSCNH